MGWNTPFGGRRKNWKIIVAGMLFTMFIVMTTAIVVWLGMTLRYARFVNKAEEAELWRQSIVLIRAIDRYTCVNGKPPAALEELVPQYLVKVPAPPHKAENWGYDAWHGKSGMYRYDFTIRYAWGVWSFDQRNNKWQSGDPGLGW